MKLRTGYLVAIAVVSPILFGIAWLQIGEALDNVVGNQMAWYGIPSTIVAFLGVGIFLLGWKTPVMERLGRQRYLSGYLLVF